MRAFGLALARGDEDAFQQELETIAERADEDEGTTLERALQQTLEGGRLRGASEASSARQRWVFTAPGRRLKVTEIPALNIPGRVR